MTKIKCPLCGMKLKEFPDEAYDISSVGCAKCQWRTFDSYPKVAWSDAENFVSKFPPIMRVQVGDEVIRNGGGAYKIQEINLEDMSLFVVNIEEKRDALWLNQDEVALWPWELEQKGGEQ